MELDYSSLSSFMECARMAENSLVHARVASRDSSATAFGTLFHSCEELRLRHGWSEATKQAQHELVAKHFMSHFPSPGDHRTADRMISVLKLYNEKYAHDGWPDKVLVHNGEKMVERPFKLELCTVNLNCEVPYRQDQLVAQPALCCSFPIRSVHILYTGVIDAILHDSNVLWVVDHKTSSMGGKTFWEAFRLSNQTRGYAWAAQQILSLPVAGAIVNGIVMRPLTKTGVGNEFDRATFFYSQDSLEECAENLRTLCSDFLANLSRGYFPQHSLSFKSPCSGCDYADNCALPPAQRAADIASDLYTDVTWNPLERR